MPQALTNTPPASLLSDHMHRRRRRARYLLSAVPTGMPFAELAEAIRFHGLAEAYGPGHAEWEYWLASRIELAHLFTRPQSWSWPSSESPEPIDIPGPALCVAAILGQGVRDLQRAMPCTLGLPHRDLVWPHYSDYRCTPAVHACAAGALAALLGPCATYLATLLGFDPGYFHDRVRHIADRTRLANPWLTFNLPPLATQANEVHHLRT